MSDIVIRQLVETDAEAYRKIRLEMLKNKPEAFGEAYEESIKKELDFFKGRITNSYIGGAFEGLDLIATAGYFIQEGLKSSHKAFLWGVYVQEKYRGNGLSYGLTLKVVGDLPSTISLIQTAVVAGNVAAEKTYKKAGFKKWAVEEKALKINGKYYDEIHMVKFLEEAL